MIHVAWHNILQTCWRQCSDNMPFDWRQLYVHSAGWSCFVMSMLWLYLHLVYQVSERQAISQTEKTTYRWQTLQNASKSGIYSQIPNASIAVMSIHRTANDSRMKNIYQGSTQKCIGNIDQQQPHKTATVSIARLTQVTTNIKSSDGMNPGYILDRNETRLLWMSVWRTQIRTNDANNWTTEIMWHTSSVHA